MASTIVPDMVDSPRVAVGRPAPPSLYRGGPASGVPGPLADLGQVLTVLADVLLVLDQLVPDHLLRVGGPLAELGDAVDHVADQVEAVEVVEDDHVEGGRGGPLL